MKQADRRKQRQSGFTLMEVLVTVAIIICLLALSFVAITKYIRHVQITELDTAAREIYMAAQNQAILLNSSGELEDCVIKTPAADAGGSTAAPASNQMDGVDVTPNPDNTVQITAYYVASTDSGAIAKLLPETSIESDLWEGKFYIVYEPVSGSVIDVFYAKDKDAFPTSESDFRAFYDTWRAAPKEDRMNHKPMIGYYGGDSAESGNSLSLRTPVVNIYNEDVLRAEVTYWIPRTLDVINSGNAEVPKGGVKLDVELSYEGKKIPLKLPTEIDKKKEDITLEYTAITYTWELDSLKDGKQFKDLLAKVEGGKDLPTGKDFTITASVSYEGKEAGMQVNGARKSATDNSLFAKGSGEETAKIACMRHLQNLDADFSGVKKKTQAKQTADITCDSTYNFVPVENAGLTSYDGGKFHIKELHADAAKASANHLKTAYGLFGRVGGMTLSNIKMVNAQISGGTSPTGAMVGSGSGMIINDCGVYWENTSANDTNLRYVLGDSDAGIKYMIQGSVAGGLAGQMSGGTITGSFAATTIEGTETNGTAGGLVGKADGSLAIEKSYADNYLAGNHAAGLIGNLTGTANVADSYATGFINSGTDDEAAGFCLGAGRMTSKRAYSTMLFSKDAANYSLSEKDGSYTYTYYLQSSFINKNDSGTGRSYADLTDAKKINTLYGDGHKFQMKSTQTTFPYNLQTTLNLTRYSYPGLAGMDHYGDWGAEFQNGSLVYYERYNKNNETAYAFNGGNLSMITDDYAVEDGYALAFLGAENIAQTGTSVTVTYRDDNGDEKTETLHYNSDEIKKITYDNKQSGKTEKYFLLPLPKRIVNTKYAAKDFYQEISFIRGNEGEQTTGRYYYNPHFANAVLEYDESFDLNAEARKVTAKIRTARHLYMLSEHAEYFSSSHPYKFLQEMDINYSIYEGYNMFPIPEGKTTRVCFQTPIGNGKKPFKGTYDGGCHTIENVGVDSKGKNYIGLFGYSQGTIKNATYLINEHTVGTIVSQRSSGTVYIGGLAGYNGGVIQNCAVAGMEINGYAYDFSTVQAGGLVGWNRGTIRNSSAALTDLTVETTLSNSYVGGFVGRNGEGGDIKKCYAVGRVNIEKSRYGNVVACGFAGTNKGSITKSYAAVDLQTSGGAKACGFCQDETSKSNYYMNEGNFSYNNVNYTAQYEDTSATPKKWSDFAEKDALSNSMGMSEPKEAKAYKAQNGEENYPYPGVVKDSKGQYIHYGMWPEMMNLNQCGIYYWEKMDGLTDKPSYYLSAIIVDPGKKTIEKIDTLSTKHGDGGIVTEYGYGYFTPANLTDAAGLASEDIAFGKGQENWTENQECNAALKKLLEDKYDFHSYKTREIDEENGLYLTSETNPYGTWTLKYKDGNQIEFNVNPFFADSMSLQDQPTDWTVKDVPTTKPGSAAKNSFQVRSVDQLQFINWNVDTKNTKTVLTADNADSFLFLGHKSADRKYFWKQTHDLQGEEGKTYTPIAELYDATPAGNEKGKMYGWFGGTYNGDDYVIQDVNVEGQRSSCVGLFGMIYNGSLKNIVMYSPTGKGTVTSQPAEDNREVAWHAIGGLAGFAATSSGSTSSAIDNCSIAGYTIRDNHIGSTGWGGTCMGGLIGISCMELKDCTSVAELKNSAKDNDNIRIGGLVGSCQKSISSCYAGGNIDVKEAKAGDNRGIYVGGIVGGVYFKPVTDPNNNDIGEKRWLENTLKNCYSYVVLPNADTTGIENKKYIKALYAVGGPGEITHGGDLDDRGNTIYENCYYLNDVVWSQNGGTAPTTKVRCDEKLQLKEGTSKYEITYKGLEPAWPNEGTQKNPNVTAMSYAGMSGGALLEKLNNNGGGFATVTTETADGNKINGKYSFTSDQALIGENYPFPTILTQKDKGSKEVNVHYGAWPIEGLSREHGSVPVDIDLFADYQAGGAVKTEDIMLSPLIKTGGDLTCEVLDENGNPLEESVKPIVKAEIARNGFAAGQRKTPLTLTGERAGSAKVKVTYEIDGRKYSTIVDVQITAELQLLPQKRPVSMFTDETASVALDVKNKKGDPIAGDLLNQIDLKEFSVELDNDYLSDAKVIKTDDGFILSMTSRNVEGISKATLDYSYIYNDTDYTGTNPISVEIAIPAINLAPLDIYLDGSNEKVVQYGADHVALAVNGKKPDSIAIVEYGQSANVQLAFVRAFTDGTLTIEGYRQDSHEDPLPTTIQLKLRFTIDGVTHESWQLLQVTVNPGAESSAP